MIQRNRSIFALVIAVVAIAIIGVLTVRSAGLAHAFRAALWSKQIVSLAAGGVGGLIAALAYPRLRRAGPMLHGAMILATIATLVIGHRIGGARRWLGGGAFSFQPSQLLELTLVIALAESLRTAPASGRRTLRDLAFPMGVVACTVIPVLEQPDLGTGILLASIALIVLAIEPWTLGAKGVAAALALAIPPLTWRFGLHAYQRSRLLSFLEGGDVWGANYQTSHSVRIIGAGGLFGRGAGSWASAEAYPLPEAHGDFALAVWAHERGLAGLALLFALYLVVIVAALRIASKARDRADMLVAVGFAGMVLVHVVMNAGMVLGLLPVVGVTLPLVSFGGSSAFALLTGVGMVLGVAMRRR